jgi:hypothetical protein
LLCQFFIGYGQQLTVICNLCQTGAASL